MIENNPTNVSSAFEILLEEIEAEIDFVNRVGSKAFESRDYDRAKEALERVGLLTAFRDRLATMRKEWNDLTVAEPDNEEARIARHNLGRLERGLRTPEQAYFLPILSVLVDLGGPARMVDVLDRVGEAMKQVLKEVDYEPLTSDPTATRWRNAAQWARHALVKEDLMRADSPRGIWQISEAGRKYLKEQSRSR